MYRHRRDAVLGAGMSRTAPRSPDNITGATSDIAAADGIAMAPSARLESARLAPT